MSIRGLVHFSFFNSKGEFDISSVFEVTVDEQMLENYIAVFENGIVVFNETIIIEMMTNLEHEYGNIRWNHEETISPIISGYTHKVSQLEVAAFMKKAREIMVDYCGEDHVGEIKYISRSLFGLDEENIYAILDSVEA